MKGNVFQQADLNLTFARQEKPSLMFYFINTFSITLPFFTAIFFSPYWWGHFCRKDFASIGANSFLKELTPFKWASQQTGNYKVVYIPIRFSHLLILIIPHQCSAEKFHNWGQCPRALEKVGTFEKKVGTVWGKWWASDLEVKNQFVIGFHHYLSYSDR